MGSDIAPTTFTTTSPSVDLVFTEVATPNPVTIGGPLHYSLQVTNLGTSTATGVTLVDTLPAVLTVNNVTSTQGTTNLVGTTLTGPLGTMRPGVTATVGIDTTAPLTPQSISNIAVVNAVQTDPVPVNNSGTQPSTIVDTAELHGRNWVDTNGNGIFETGEIPLPGVSLLLTGTNDLGQSVSITTTSQLDGSYDFLNLRPGTYTVTQTQPTFFVDGLDYLGSVGGTVPAKNQLRLTLVPGVDV